MLLFFVLHCSFDWEIERLLCSGVIPLSGLAWFFFWGQNPSLGMGPLGIGLITPVPPFPPSGCAFSEWGAWSACNATCGAGTQSRVRYAQFYTPQCAASQAPTQAVQSCEAAPCQPPPNQGVWPAHVFLPKQMPSRVSRYMFPINTAPINWGGFN